MIPTSFIALDGLPLTPNGKIIRRLLPTPPSSRPEFESPKAAPRNEVEKGLAQIWKDVLALDEIGIHDDFFDLGGHSIAAFRVVTGVIKQFKLEIPLQALFESPTIADMAALITADQVKILDEQGLTHLLDELESLSDEDAKRLLGETNSTITPK
jgi:acyl carrier protein